MTISYLSAPSDRVRDVLFRGIPEYCIRSIEDSIFYSVSSCVPKGQGRTLDAASKDALVNSHLQKIPARLDGASIPTPPEPNPEFYKATPENYKNDVYAFYHWTRKSKDLQKMKKDFSITELPTLSSEYTCECCGETFLLQFGKLGSSCNTPCPNCGHDGAPGCLCPVCTQHTAILKQNIQNLLASVERIIENEWMQILDKLSEISVAPCAEPRDSELYLLSAKYRTSSLSSDERCFLHHYKEMTAKGLKVAVLDLINHAPLKNPGKALKDLVDHGVLISKTTPRVPDKASVISALKNELFPDIHIDCDLPRGRGWLRLSSFTESSISDWSFDDILKVRSIQIYSDQQIVHERVMSCALKILTMPGPSEYRVNPYYLEPLSPAPKSESDDGGSLKVATAVTTVFKSPQECALFESLQKEYLGYIILPNYPVANIVDFKKLPDEFSRDELSVSRRMLFDFVICNPAGYPICIVECQHGKHHNDPEHIRKDYLKMKLCAAAGLKHYEIHGRFDEHLLA